MQYTAGRKIRASELNYDSAAGVDCHYRASANQSLPNTAVTPVLFDTAVRSTTLVTRAAFGSGHTFTVNRAGLWSISAMVRISGGTVPGQRFISLANNTTGVLEMETGLSVGSTAALLIPLSGTLYLPTGNAIYVGYYVDGGSAATTNVANNNVSLRMCWLHD